MKRFLIGLALAVLAALCLCFLMAGAEQAADASALYVSPNGNDANTGTINAPLQSPAEAVRRLSLLPEGAEATIWLRGGEYVLEKTLWLNDQGRNKIALRAFPGETPVITGARQVTGFAPAEYMGGAVWRAQVTEANVRALYGESGARAVVRWPSSGYLLATGTADPEADKSEGQQLFYANPADFPPNLKGATLRLLHWWKDEYSAVVAANPQTGLITLRRRTAMAVAEGDRYFFENVPDVPLMPGEWLFEADTRSLYYAPQPGETIDNTPLYISHNDRLLGISDVLGVTLDGIIFTRTGFDIPNNDRYADFPQAAYDADTAIYVARAQNIAFQNCTFIDMGAGCLYLGPGTHNASVMSCTFRNIGAQAIFVEGENAAMSSDTSGQMTMMDNRIENYGLNFYNAAAILVIHARDITIAHNEISGGYYTAISAGWVWGNGYSATRNIRITNNLIYNIGQRRLSDMGAIYLLGAQSGTVVAGNIIHDVYAEGYGGRGIYLDEGAASILVERNLVYRCSGQAFYQHSGGAGNIVKNNIFTQCQEGLVGLSGLGTFTLSGNMLVGEAPYVRPEGEATAPEGQNYCTEDEEAAFFGAGMENFAPRPSAALDAVGFVSWVFQAGVRVR
ncbi:MAG: right-handed parallel beta-helix repeat-containing protein [Oscillospiraceae bacterium]|jgi:hypothetical protein|nr:right-handed parallel beta-helix repeat-containing protein [Oscillospiraceae bacterium]